MKEIDCNTYLWQKELVRLRALEDVNWKSHNYLKKSASKLLDYKMNDGQLVQKQKKWLKYLPVLNLVYKD